jgi:hypothetical protein
MIQLVDQTPAYFEFETVDEALDFLWGKDASKYRVLVSIPNGYKAARELLENANVSSEDRPQSGRTPPDGSGSNIPEIPQVEREPEEPETSIAGNMPSIGLGFEAGPKR